MMNEQKKIELDKMYELRAGLSLISQQCDVIERMETQEENYRTESEEQFYNMNHARNERDQYGRELKSTKPKKWIIYLLLVPCIVLTVLAIIVMLEFKQGFSFATLFVLLFILFWDGMAIAWLCLKISDCILYKKDLKELETKSSTVAAYSNNYEDAINKFKELYNSNLPTKIKLANVSEAIKNSLNQEFGSLVDIRDWENLDLIIFYYETGRADSIKEALQLVDQERRNNALIDAIGLATTEICRSIRSLGGVIIQGFKSLSAQLDAQRVQIGTALTEIATAQALGNALLEKANVSSKKMVEQMNKLNNKLK